MKTIALKPDAFTEPTGKAVALATSLESQQAASMRIPFVKSPDSVQGALIGPKSLTYFEVVVAGNQKYPIVVKGDYIYVDKIVYDTTELQNVSNFPPRVRTDTLQTPIVLFEQHREINFPISYEKVEIENPSGYSLVIGVWVGFGKIRRDRDTKFSRALGVVAPAFAAPYPVGDSFGIATFTGLDTQWGTLKRANYSVRGNNSTASNFSLWMFARQPVANDGDPFQFLPGGISEYDVLAKINFASFVAGATGTGAICFATGLDIPVFAKTLNSAGQPTLTIYGVVVTNAIYTAAPSEAHYIDLIFELP